MKTVLVAGSSGLVGKNLTSLLKQKGFRVHTLSNSLSTNIAIGRFHWSPNVGEIDATCLEGVDYVINLSGAGLFDHRWTKSYKQKIIESRTKSTELLVHTIVKGQFPIAVFINASATGIYGSNTSDRWVNEETQPDNDFLAEVVKQWEESLLKQDELKTRKVCLRFGIVLSNQGGALPQLAAPVRGFIGSPFGTGNQYISWIHLQDLSRLMVFALEHSSMEGAYNAVSDQPVTNEEMIKEIAKQLHRTLWMPHVPAFVLNLILGKERAAALLGGNRVENEKIRTKGFEFEYKTLTQALHNFFSSKE
ncbi:MAG: epimerase [Chitinophagaceae bacterium]|nr:epimerase [Chitinophagaceae bacterium]